MAIVEVSITPLGSPTTSVSAYVAGAQKILERQQKVRHQLTPMGTVLEGDLDEILEVVRQMHESVFEMGQQRVSTLIKIDDRRDQVSTLEGKVRSVEQKLSKSQDLS